MVKNLNLFDNSTAVRPSAHPSVLHQVPKCNGAKSSRGINTFGAETSWCRTSRAEWSRCRNDLVPKCL